MLKIIILTLVCAFIITYLKHSKSELTDVALIASSILILYLSFDYVINTFGIIQKIISLTGISEEYYKIILKVVSISYVLEFSSSTIEDMGLKSLSNKIVFVGKLFILAVSSPLLIAIFNIISGILT
jgi:stage III sporulation protein AD